MPSKLIRSTALIGVVLAATLGLSAGGLADDASPSAPAAGATPAPAVPPSASPANPAPSTPAPATPSPGIPTPATPAPATANPAPTSPAAPATSTPANPAPVSPPANTPVPGNAAPPASAPAGTPPAPGAPAPSTPAPAAPEPGKPAEQAAPSGDSTGQTVELAARPFAFVEGKADRDEIYTSIRASLDVVRREIEKAGLKPAGKPIAVFLQSDDSGFRYHAGLPIEAAPAGKTSLSDAVKLGETPAGRAMRFQHLGAYTDIDATYDAITAYLDEKGIDAQDSFIEEYENDAKDADDPNLEVDIFVMTK